MGPCALPCIHQPCCVRQAEANLDPGAEVVKRPLLNQHVNISSCCAPAHCLNSHSYRMPAPGATAKRDRNGPPEGPRGAQMTEKRLDGRILIYSHDTMGLGHLRRCRTIAHSLVEKFKHVSVLILSGSPIIGSFDFRARVDFVRVPG